MHVYNASFYVFVSEKCAIFEKFLKTPWNVCSGKSQTSSSFNTGMAKFSKIFRNWKARIFDVHCLQHRCILTLSFKESLPNQISEIWFRWWHPCDGVFEFNLNSEIEKTLSIQEEITRGTKPFYGYAYRFIRAFLDGWMRTIRFLEQEKERASHRVWVSV